MNNRNKIALASAFALAIVGGATPVQSSPIYYPSLVVSSKLPEPTFERLSGISIVKGPKYTVKSRLTANELKDLLYQVGFRGEALRLAWGTAMKESTGRPMAHNKNSNTGDNSYGLFQINMIGSLGPARLEKYGLDSNKDLFDPFTNATIAFQMSDGGKDWSAWHGITESTRKWLKEFPG